jgi:hypothetical protein
LSLHCPFVVPILDGKSAFRLEITGGLVSKGMLGSPCLRRRGRSASCGIYRNVVAVRALTRNVHHCGPLVAAINCRLAVGGVSPWLFLDHRRPMLLDPPQHRNTNVLNGVQHSSHIVIFLDIKMPYTNVYMLDKEVSQTDCVYKTIQFDRACTSEKFHGMNPQVP